MNSIAANLSLQSIAQTVAAQIGDCLVVGTLILLLAMAMSWLLRGQRSSVRFTLWFSALLAIVLTVLFHGSWIQTHHASNVLPSPTLRLPAIWALYFFATWMLAASLALLRIVAGLWQLRALRQNLQVLDSVDIPAHLREIMAHFPPGRRFSLCLSHQIQSPTAIGLLSPAIVLPYWVMEQSSPEELEQILLHELAHLRRWDDWSNLLQKVIKALLIFHPAVWWIESKLSLEREMACDDAVLAETQNPRAYAQCLARLAEKSVLRRSILLAQAAVSRLRQTTLRVQQILNRRDLASSSNRLAPFIAVPVIAVMAGGLVLTQHVPRLVAFENAPLKMAEVPVRAGTSALVYTSWQPKVMGKQLALPTPSQVKNVSYKLPAAVNTKFSKKNVKPKPPKIYPGIAQQSPAINNSIAPTLTATNVSSMSVSPTPIAQTVVIFIQSRQDISSGQTVWQWQMWQFTVWQPTHSQVEKGTTQKVI